MKCAIQINKKDKRKWIISGILFIIFMVFVCETSICLIRKRGIQTTEEKYFRQEEEGGRKEERAIEMEAYLKELENEFVEFEKLFWENQEDMQKFVEVSQESVLGEIEYVMFLDESNYPAKKSPYKLEGWISILYDDGIFSVEENEEMSESLNENINLKEALKAIKEKGVVEGISRINSMGTEGKIAFEIDTPYTSFIITNNGITNDIAYCTDNNCEKYGYRNIEDNWYMWIPPAPE